jgi:hypothetical protein
VGFGEKGFQLVHVSRFWDSVAAAWRQFHNLGACPIKSSSQRLVEKAVLTIIRAKLSMAFGRSVIAIQHTLQGCGCGAGIKYLSRIEEQVGPTPCARKRVHEFNVGLCVAQMDIHRNKSNTNISQGFVLSPPGGGFEPKT